MHLYKRLYIEFPDDVPDDKLQAVYKLLGETNATTRIPFGNDLRDAKLIILNEDGKITGAQG